MSQSKNIMVVPFRAMYSILYSLLHNFTTVDNYLKRYILEEPRQTATARDIMFLVKKKTREPFNLADPNTHQHSPSPVPQKSKLTKDDTNTSSSWSEYKNHDIFNASSISNQSLGSASPSIGVRAVMIATKLSRSVCEPIAALFVIWILAAATAVSRAVSTRLPCWKRQSSSPGLLFVCPAECGLFYASLVSFQMQERFLGGGRGGGGRLKSMTAALSVSTFASVACIRALVAFQIARYWRSIAKRVTLASLAFARGGKLKRAVTSART